MSAFERTLKNSINRTDIQRFQSNNGHLTMTFVISAFQMYALHFAHFSKTGKTRVSHRVKMMTQWPGREDPNDSPTRWPNDPVPCLTDAAPCRIAWRHVTVTCLKVCGTRLDDNLPTWTCSNAGTFTNKDDVQVWNPYRPRYDVGKITINSFSFCKCF